MRKIALLLLLGYVTVACNDKNCHSSKTSFNADWKFVRMDSCCADVEKDILQGDTEYMKDVALPHTPRIEPLTVNDQWQGICYYSKSFNVADTAQLYALHFEGAMNVADVWLNGSHLQSHTGGYLPFTVPLNEALRADENRVVVRLDNRDNAVTGPKPLHLLDFCTYGGIYRNVWLVAKDSTYITDAIAADKPADGGVFVHCENISTEQATVTARVNITNAAARKANLQIHYTIEDAQRKAIVQDAKQFCIDAQSNSSQQVSFTLPNPQLWDIDNPQLYTLNVEVENDGETIDSQRTTFGIRKVEITPTELRLNGQKRFLRGVNRHQEYPYVGYALSDEAQRRDARKIKAAGFDYVRLSHYPQATAFLDECDRLGIMVLDAILGWQYFGDSLFESHALRSSRELIRRDRNHPCVLAWELSINETDMPDSFVNAANKLAHEEFPFDDCYVAGWKKGVYDIYIEARQHRHGIDYNLPLLVSEYGDWEYYAQNAGFNQQDWGNLMPDERSSRQPRFAGEKRLLQQARNVQEAHNDNLMTHAFADGYWAMFDYNRGYTDDLEYSGIMDITRLPKFSHYFYKSQRSETPELFIASYWQPGISQSVRVFSNCESVGLYVDGQLVAEQTPDIENMSNRLSHPPFTFDVACTKTGKLKAVGYIDHKVAVEHEVCTPDTASTLILRIDESGIAPVTNDVLLVYAEIRDKNGTIVPTADTEVTFSVNGATLQSPATVKAEAGIATAVIRTGFNPEPVEIKANANNLLEHTLSFNVQANYK